MTVDPISLGGRIRAACVPSSFHKNPVDFYFCGQTMDEVMAMAYINPMLLPKLEELQPELKEEILSRNVPLNNLHDLIAIMERIIDEVEAKQ